MKDNHISSQISISIYNDLFNEEKIKLDIKQKIKDY